MSTYAEVLIKTDVDPTFIADILLASLGGEITQNNTEFGRELHVRNRCGIAVVNAEFDDDRDMKFSEYQIAAIIWSYSNDHGTHQKECLTIGQEIMQIIIKRLRLPCLLAHDMQKIIAVSEPDKAQPG